MNAVSQSTCRCNEGFLLRNLDNSQEVTAQIEQIIAEHRSVPGALIQVLHKVQGIIGYLPQDAQEIVAAGLRVPLSEVSGVVSFYSFFSEMPKGRHHIAICHGTACYVKGSGQVGERLEKDLGIGYGETTPDGEFSLEVVRCLGACGLGPVLTVNEKVHARVKPDQVGQLLKSYRKTATVDKEGE